MPHELALALNVGFAIAAVTLGVLSGVFWFMASLVSREVSDDLQADDVAILRVLVVNTIKSNRLNALAALLTAGAALFSAASTIVATLL
jgi:hypothetical protein